MRMPTLPFRISEKYYIVVVCQNISGDHLSLCTAVTGSALSITQRGKNGDSSPALALSHLKHFVGIQSSVLSSSDSERSTDMMLTSGLLCHKDPVVLLYCAIRSLPGSLMLFCHSDLCEELESSKVGAAQITLNIHHIQTQSRNTNYSIETLQPRRQNRIRSKQTRLH